MPLVVTASGNPVRRSDGARSLTGGDDVAAWKNTITGEALWGTCLTLAGAALAGIVMLGAAKMACAAEVWRVGTWKTAQTIQPFLYEKYAPPAACGLKVDVLPFTNPADQKAALLAESLDMTGTTLSLAIQAASRGEPVRLVAALGNKCSALVVAKDGPVRTAADLRGRRIAYVPGTMHEILLREVLHREGIDPARDVTLMRIDFFDMGTALAKGNVDAFLSGEPFPTQAVMQGYGRILAYPYYGDSIGTINSGMLMRAEFIKEHPDISGMERHALHTFQRNGEGSHPLCPPLEHKKCTPFQSRAFIFSWAVQTNQPPYPFRNGLLAMCCHPFARLVAMAK